MSLLSLPVSSVHKECPPGFRQLHFPNGFLGHCGDLYLHETAPVLAARITGAQLNGQGIVHGGYLATLADTAYGVMLRRSQPALLPRTVQLNVSYLDAVFEGDFVEAHVTFHKRGKRLAYGMCNIVVGARMVLQTSAVFSVVAADAVTAPHATGTDGKRME